MKNARRCRRLTTALVSAWVLVHSDTGTEWTVVGQFTSPVPCLQTRTAVVDREVQGSIGGVLAGQPVDNPLRQEAYRRAARHVEDRYRCAEVR